MKIAILALTVGGKSLAERLAALYQVNGQEAHVFLPGKLKETYQLAVKQPEDKALLVNLDEELRISPEVRYYEGPIKDLAAELFPKYAGFVFIMATGIVIRTIAPFIKDKGTDPAVLVLDEKGDFVIPMLSGHLGGANALAKQIAKLLGATPVITTSTDVQGKLAPDVVAREFNLLIEPWENLVKLNSSVANGAKVGWFAEPDLANLINRDYQDVTFQYLPKALETANSYQGLIYITNRFLPKPDKPYLFLRPKNLILGIGCRRGTPTEEIVQAIQKTLAQAGVSSKSLAKLASVDVKSDEQGIIEAAEYFKVPVEFYSREKIEEAFKLWPEMSRSDYVRKQIGVDGVCEPVAMLGGTKTTLLMKKQAFQGITTALAEDVCW